MARRHVIMFQSRFAPGVEAGTKPNTIRPERKRTIAPGDALSLRQWIGKAYRSKQRRLRDAVCSNVRDIEIDAIKGLIWLDGEGLLTARAANKLARLDGFKDRGEMADWFEATHGLPFTGVLIEWRT